MCKPPRNRVGLIIIKVLGLECNISMTWKSLAAIRRKYRGLDAKRKLIGVRC